MCWRRSYLISYSLPHGTPARFSQNRCNVTAERMIPLRLAGVAYSPRVMTKPMAAHGQRVEPNKEKKSHVKSIRARSHARPDQVRNNHFFCFVFLLTGLVVTLMYTSSWEGLRCSEHNDETLSLAFGTTRVNVVWSGDITGGEKPLETTVHPSKRFSLVLISSLCDDGLVRFWLTKTARLRLREKHA